MAIAYATLYLMRHAEYTVETRPAQPPDGALTRRGEVQAQSTAERLTRLNVGAIYSSPARRAQHTAAIVALALGLTPATDARLSETIPPVALDLRSRYFNAVSENELALGSVHLEAAYSFCWSGAVQEHATVLVTHGNLIAGLVCRALGMGQHWFWLNTDHSALTELHLREDGQVLVLRHGDNGHLSPPLQTR